MELRILGSFEVCDDSGRGVKLPAGRERALLAVLLLRRGEVVSTDALVDALGARRLRAPPRRPSRGTSRTCGASSTRPAAAGALETQPPGYLLRVDDDRVDAFRFEALAARGWRELESEPGDGARDLRGGARALAWPRALGVRLRGVRPARDPASGRAPARDGGGPDRGDPASRTARGGRRRARDAGRGASAARASPRPAHARPLPRRPPGRGARGVPRGSHAALGPARPRAGNRPAAARAGDPRAGSSARRAGGAAARSGRRALRRWSSAQPGTTRLRRSAAGGRRDRGRRAGVLPRGRRIARSGGSAAACARGHRPHEQPGRRVDQGWLATDHGRRRRGRRVGRRHT